MLLLSPKEQRILSGGWLTHSGRPFHFVPKHVFGPGVWERITEINFATCQNRDPRGMPLEPFELPDDIVESVKVVLQNCLDEFGGSGTDCRLHLNAQDRRPVDDLIRRLEDHLRSAKTDSSANH